MPMSGAADVHNVKSVPALGRFLWAQLLTTAVFEVWQSCLLYAIWSVTVTLIYQLVDTDIAIGSSLISVLGTLIAFSITLRTSEGYARWLEGRRLWAQLGLNCRNLATLIWIHMRQKPAAAKDAPAAPGGDEDATSPVESDAAAAASASEEAVMRLMLEKRSIIGLIDAYALANKHALRGETGPYYEDLYPHLAALPRFSHPVAAGERSERDVATIWRHNHEDVGAIVLPYGGLGSQTATTPLFGRSVETFDKLGASVSSSQLLEKQHGSEDSRPPIERVPTTTHIELKPAYCPPKKTIYDHFPLLFALRPALHALFGLTRSDEEEREHELRKERRQRRHLDSNIVLELQLHIHSYIAAANVAGQIDAMYTGQLLAAIGAMNDCSSNLLRIRTTPLPSAYLAHLTIVVHVYLILLPTMLVSTFGWISVLGVVVCAFFFNGFLWVGSALEDPFGYDASDLDLDSFAADLSADLAEICAHVPHTFENVVDDPLNRPFAGTGDNRTAAQILGHPAHDRLGHLRRDLAEQHIRELRVRTTATRRFLKKAHTKLEVTRLEDAEKMV